MNSADSLSSKEALKEILTAYKKGRKGLVRWDNTVLPKHEYEFLIDIDAITPAGIAAEKCIVATKGGATKVCFYDDDPFMASKIEMFRKEDFDVQDSYLPRKYNVFIELKRQIENDMWFELEKYPEEMKAHRAMVIKQMAKIKAKFPGKKKPYAQASA